MSDYLPFVDELSRLRGAERKKARLSCVVAARYEVEGLPPVTGDEVWRACSQTFCLQAASESVIDPRSYAGSLF